MDKTPPNWDLYRAFLAVLETGSLSAAARRLRATQPTVGRQIAQLEDQLKVPLFTRSRHGLNPTQTAFAFAPHARTMAAAAENLARLASGDAEAEQGTVRLAASEVMGVEVLPAILADFQSYYPKITIELVLSNRPEDLLQREADLAVRMFRPSQDALIAKHIGRIPVGLYAHQRYVAAHGAPRTMAALAEHAMIGLDKLSWPSSAAPMLAQLPTRESYTFRCDHDLAQLAALRAGCGIGICQAGIARSDPRLVAVLPAAFALHLDTWLVMHEDLRTSLRVRQLFDHLSTGLQAYVKEGEGEAPFSA